MIKRFHLLIFLSFLIVITTAGCSSTDKDSANSSEPQESVEVMYRKASKSLDVGNYITAAKEFDEVEQNYPYSGWATKSQIMAAYAHYKNLKYDDALLTIDRFIQLHPGDINIAYAYYLKALCYYEQISDVRRDQKMTELALKALKQVKSRFPNSKYAKDASLKIDLAVDHMAGKEMEIGRYYLERKHYNAAINRFETVIEQYQTTTHTAEALHRLTEAYLSLGIISEAKKNAAILRQNFPQSQWYKDSYRLLTDSDGRVIKTTDKGISVKNKVKATKKTSENKKPKTEKKKSFYARTLGKLFN